MERSGTVILVGPLAPYEQDKGDAQIWCLNRGYLHQPNLDRLYMMDPLPDYIEHWGEGFIDEVNALGVPVCMRERYPEIHNSVQFGFEGSFDTFSISFFGATAANAIANAIEGTFSDLVLHRMYVKGESDAYRHHKAVVAFWVGQALGSGIRVHVDPNCFMEQDLMDKAHAESTFRQEQMESGIDVGLPPVPPLHDMLMNEYKHIEARKAEGAIA